MSSAAVPGPGHNRGPLTPPTEDDLIADLRVRYPEVEPKLAELTAAAESAPKKIEDDETAGKVQDLYRTIKKFQSTWKAWRGVEKGPWDKLAKVALNFFKEPEDKLESLALELRERHTAFTERKAEEARAEAERKAAAERAEAERLRKEAEAAEQRRLLAEQAEREANEREEKARSEEAAAKERKRLAEEAAERARAEEKRIADEKRQREQAEKEQNADTLRTASTVLRDAERLNEAAGDEEEGAPELERMIALVRQHASSALRSTLLSDEQISKARSLLERADELRKANMDRLDAKEKRKRAAEEKKRVEEDARLAEERRKVREADEARAAKAREEREKAEAEAAKAKQEAKDARSEARTAAADADEAYSDQRTHERAGAKTAKQADKVQNRADRMDNRISNASDADMSRTRGAYSVGALSGRWSPRIIDRDALVQTLGVLGPYIHTDAVDAAITKFMRQHQGEWADQRREGKVEGKLPGVLFDWVSDSRIV